MSAVQTKTVTFTLNGVETTKTIDVRLSLLECLRDVCGVMSVKEGCGVGECGACTVLIDGEPFDSCIYLAAWIDGKTVETVEGLCAPDGTLGVTQQAFVDTFAIQCGFCTPGFVLAAEAVRREKTRFTRDELRRKLAGNLCRCTGYENILRAVELAIERTLTA